MNQIHREPIWRILSIISLLVAIGCKSDRDASTSKPMETPADQTPSITENPVPKTPEPEGADRMGELLERGAPKRILFFTVDALSAKHVSTYGYPRLTNPALTHMARESVVFENAIAPAPWTYPSYASQLTSRHSITAMGFKGSAIPAEEITLAEYLHELGYYTAGFVDNQYLHPKHGMNQGFDYYEAYHKSRRKCLLRALEWLEKQPDIPLFLFVHTNDVHGPYVPEDPFATLFDNDNHRGPTKTVKILKNRAPHVFGAMPRYQAQKNRNDVNFYISRYDASIRQTDFDFERILQALKKLGDWDDTVVIYSADHGESLGNHSFYFNHGLVYEDIIRVPLVIKLQKGALGGKRIATQVSLLDLLPTVLDILKTKPRNPIAGSSLMPLMRGEKNTQSDYVFASQGIFEQFMIRTDEWKLIKFIPGTAEQKQAWRTFPGIDLNQPDKVYYELYDMKKDRDEKRNLADKHPDLKNLLSKRLEEWIRRPQDYKAVDVQFNKQEIERLRNLGYLE